MIGIFSFYLSRLSLYCLGPGAPSWSTVDTVVVVVVVVTTLVVGGDSVGVHLGLSVLKFINKC
jgi:hypothetical protein